ncbi:8917_t:CDS:2, partial [Acaulospora morrowiae]
IDDPLIWGSLPLRVFSSRDRLRWALGAQEICFTTPFLSGFFALGQVVPIVRGAGVFQPAMNFAIDRLNEGKWVHIFPEGRVNSETDLLRFKWGVGRLMMESTNSPIVVPLCLKGLPYSLVQLIMGIVISILKLFSSRELGPEEIMPERRVNNCWIPVLGKKVVITYGKPIDFKGTLKSHYEKEAEEIVTRIAITDRIFRAISELQKKDQFIGGCNIRG